MRYDDVQDTGLYASPNMQHVAHASAPRAFELHVLFRAALVDDHPLRTWQQHLGWMKGVLRRVCAKITIAYLLAAHRTLGLGIDGKRLALHLQVSDLRLEALGPYQLRGNHRCSPSAHRGPKHALEVCVQGIKGSVIGYQLQCRKRIQVLRGVVSKEVLERFSEELGTGSVFGVVVGLEVQLQQYVQKLRTSWPRVFVIRKLVIFSPLVDAVFLRRTVVLEIVYVNLHNGSMQTHARVQDNPFCVQTALLYEVEHTWLVELVVMRDEVPELLTCIFDNLLGCLCFHEGVVSLEQSLRIEVVKLGFLVVL
mmetsp:Transcript_18611/g.35840  ORF Transcript_18611/g.35840 Transcript_18611/m.35840 type:complete len:309 (-) Transcript_18611:151-1077(-)